MSRRLYEHVVGGVGGALAGAAFIAAAWAAAHVVVEIGVWVWRVVSGGS